MHCPAPCGRCTSLFVHPTAAGVRGAQSKSLAHPHPLVLPGSDTAMKDALRFGVRYEDATAYSSDASYEPGWVATVLPALVDQLRTGAIE